VLSVALCAAGPVQAGESTDDSSSEATGSSDRGAVPRGASGAIIVPPKGAADPDATKITPPKLTRYAEPEYPASAIEAGAEGEVVLRLTVERDGTVGHVAVERGPGHGLNEAAWAAARQLQFEAARNAAGEAVRADVLFRYEFGLEPAPAPGAAAVTAALTGALVTGAGNVPVPGVGMTARDAQGKSWTVVTDALGRFSFQPLPIGIVAVTIVAPGYETLRIEESLARGESLDVRYRLRATAAAGEAVGAIDVYVEGKRPSREVVHRRLERGEVDRIPGTRGDALRSVESLPGVARPPGGAGLLIVRGSAPQDSQTFIDRMPIPLTYHFGGLSSVVPTELLQGIDFYPGNFSSRYGRAMGGVVDVELRSPSPDGAYHGLAQLDLIDARLLFEGPIPWTDSWTFLAAGRRSYVDAWLGPVLEEAGADVAQAPVYWDYQFMVEHRAAADTRLRLSVLGSDDAFEIVGGDLPSAAVGGFDLHTAFQRAQLYFDHQLPEGHRLDWSVAFGRDLIEFDIGAFFVSVEGLSLYNRLEYAHRLAESFTLNLGLDLATGMADVAYRAPVPPERGEPASQPFVTADTEETSFDRPFYRPAAYLELEAEPVRRLRLVPGVRVDLSSANGQVDLSPRFNARYGLFDGFPQTTIKTGVGMYAQPPAFFVLVGPLGNPNLESNRSIHYGAGVEQEITRQLEVSLEGYLKELDNLVVGTAQSGYTNLGAGRVYGGELMLKYKPDEYFFGWLAYTLSRSVRQDEPDGEVYLYEFDQTHNLTVLGSFRIGRGWEIGARFRLASGRLMTPGVCDPDDDGCDASSINSIYHAASASYLAFVATGDEQERLPLAHQLDLRVDKTWTFEAWKLSWYVDLQNVYNYRSPEGIIYNYNYTDRTYLGGLPILPSMGLRGQF
jgi:TonB family protein